MDASPTLSPAQVAMYMVESGVAKHRDRYENVFFKAVGCSIAVVVLADTHCAGPRGRDALLWRPLVRGHLWRSDWAHRVRSWNREDPRRVCLSCRFGHVSSWRFGGHGDTQLSPSQDRAARPRATHEQHDGKSPYATSDQRSHTSAAKIFPMAIIKRAIPWWSLPINFLLGKFSELSSPWGSLPHDDVPAVTFGNLVGSLFFAAVLVKCTYMRSHTHTPPHTHTNRSNDADSGIVSTEPYSSYIQAFAM